MNVRFELFVSDIDKSAAFYRDVLGFEEESAPGDMGWYSFTETISRART